MTEAVLVAEIAEIALAVAETVAAMVVKSEANVVAIVEVAAVVGLPAADFLVAAALPAVVFPEVADFLAAEALLGVVFPEVAAAGLIQAASSSDSIPMVTG